MVEVLKPTLYNESMTKMESYILISEFAEAVGVTVQAIHKAVKQGRIKDTKRMGQFWLIHKSEIQRFKENRI